MSSRTMTRMGRILPLAAGGAKAVAKTSHRIGRIRGRREARRGPSRFVLLLAGSGAGAAAEFLLDPQQGKRRRHTMRDWTLARLRRGSREAGRKSRYMADKAQGLAAEAIDPGRDGSELNDPALAAKVESELFRPEDAPKGSVDVNVQGGIVYLRGEVSSKEQLRELIERAQSIDGVARAESLLHVPGEPAANSS